MKKLLLFDIDGTLIHSGGAGSRALNAACQMLHGIADACSLVTLDGMTDRAIVRRILRVAYQDSELQSEEQRIDQILDAYLANLAEEVRTAPAYKVLPGIETLLAALAQQPQLWLSLATGNLRQGAQIKLTRGNLNHFFKGGGFGCDSELRPELVYKGFERAQELSGEKFLPENTYVIGDTEHDIAAGKKLGFQTVAVATGSYDATQLANYKPDFIFENFGRTHDVLKVFAC